MTVVRNATPADVEGVAAVVRDVWAREILPEVCRAQTEDDTSGLWVAVEEGHVVGFASAFLTVNEAQDRRWELDLVAVTPALQGQGLGERLIRRACQDGAQRDIALVRALVRVGNVASQKAFGRAGFMTDRRVYHLLQWSPRPARTPAAAVDGVSLLPVDTLVYRGLWIEGLEDVSPIRQSSAVAAARSIIAREGRLTAGALVAADREHLLAAGVRSRAETIGAYYWFVTPISAAGTQRQTMLRHGPGQCPQRVVDFPHQLTERQHEDLRSHIRSRVSG